MANKLLFLILTNLVFLFSCNNQKLVQDTISEPIVQNEDYTQDNTHNSRNSLDWQGMYSGVLPCADCEGIRMTLALQDGKYRMTRTYLVKDSFNRHSEGEFTWSEDGSAITLLGEGDAPAKYKVGENKLFQLDMDGKVITGVLAERYVLEKANSPILDITWKLSELDGKAVEIKGIKPFNLLFDTVAGTARGFAGCNGFAGEFVVKDQQLQVFGVFHTELGCEPSVMDIEKEYIKVLEGVDNFTLDGDILVFKKGDAVLAKFMKEG